MLTAEEAWRRWLGCPTIQERFEHSSPNAGRHHWPKAAKCSFEALHPAPRQSEQGQPVQSAAQVPEETHCVTSAEYFSTSALPSLL
eukprot:5133526-Pyramimonas_sp.AAC.1